MSSESALLESEWRQGTVLPHKLVPEGILPASATIDTKLVVISHDCDLVHASYEAEPYVEFFVARLKPDTARDGRLFNGKNPRRYQFFADDSGARRLYEVDVHEKHSDTAQDFRGRGPRPNNYHQLSRHSELGQMGNASVPQALPPHSVSEPGV